MGVPGPGFPPVASAVVKKVVQAPTFPPGKLEARGTSWSVHRPSSSEKFIIIIFVPSRGLSANLLPHSTAKLLHPTEPHQLTTSHRSRPRAPTPPRRCSSFSLFLLPTPNNNPCPPLSLSSRTRSPFRQDVPHRPPHRRRAPRRCCCRPRRRRPGSVVDVHGLEAEPRCRQEARLRGVGWCQQDGCRPGVRERRRPVEDGRRGEDHEPAGWV